MALILIECGASVNCSNHHGFTPLSSAVSYGREYMVEVLRGLGASVNSVSTDGLTPLHVACARNEYALAKLLISHGGDLNKKKTHKETHPKYKGEDKYFPGKISVVNPDSSSPLHLLDGR